MLICIFLLYSIKNKMDISIQFTKEELMILSKALVIGSVHLENETESRIMQVLEKKISMIFELQR